MIALSDRARAPAAWTTTAQHAPQPAARRRATAEGKGNPSGRVISPTAPQGPRRAQRSAVMNPYFQEDEETFHEETLL